MPRPDRAATSPLRSFWTKVGAYPVYGLRGGPPPGADAPDVVLLHGIGVSTRQLVPLAERLSGTCRVYAPDLPGFGNSGKPPRALGIADLADAVAEWMQSARVPPAAAVGASFGCQVAVELALRHAPLTRTLVLAGPTIDRHARTAARQIARFLSNARLEAGEQASVVMRDYLSAGIERVLRTFDDALADRVEEKLPAVQLPALVARGSRDVIASQAWAEEVSRLLPKGRLVVIPGATHSLARSAPERLARVICAFLGPMQPRGTPR